MRKTAILAIIVLLAMFVMPMASANPVIYFKPTDSIVPNGYCNTTVVEVWINTSQCTPGTGVNALDVAINYDPNCTKIVDVDYTGCGWTLASWNETGLSSCWGPGYDWATMVLFGADQTGDFRAFNLTFHCNNASCPYCMTNLNFTNGYNATNPGGSCAYAVTNASGAALTPVFGNGTLACGNKPVDLNVTEVYLNPGDQRANFTRRVYCNQINDITAIVRNNGLGVVVGDFDVCFEVDGNPIDCVTVTVPPGGLASGAEIPVYATWKPNCSDYYVESSYPSQSHSFTINVTADCNCSSCPNCPDGTCGKITESDEANNRLSTYIPDLLPVSGTNGHITGIVNNGYKSKHCDCNASEDPLDDCKSYTLIGGGLEYNLTGTEHTFANGSTDTRVHSITLPIGSGVNVKEARLYVYWRDNWGNFDIYPSGCLANLSVNISGPLGKSIDLEPEVVHQDSKGFDDYLDPKGVSVFNVTDWVGDSSDSYTVNVTNVDPLNETKLMGEMLVVVYENTSDDTTVQIWMCEGTDYLYATDATHGDHRFHVSPAEATATIQFSGTESLINIASANLITVVGYGEAAGSNMLFNGNAIKEDAWNFAGIGHIQVEEMPLEIAGNFTPGTTSNVGFMDNDTNGLWAYNTFLVVEKMSEVLVKCAEPTYKVSYNPGMATVNITLAGMVDYGSGTIHLRYDHTVVDTNLSLIGNGDSDAITPCLSQGHLEISAHNTSGVDDPTFATVTFYPTGSPGDCCTLNLTVEKLYDRNYTEMQTVTLDSTICIDEHQKPTVTCQSASPPVILNDTTRARAQYPIGYPYSTNMSNLSVHVTDATNVAAVYIDLTPLGLGIVPMDGPDGTMGGDWYCNKTNSLYSSLIPYDLKVMAVDCHDNWNNETNISLEVQRRGDVTGAGNVHDNKVNVKDYLYIARYTVDLEPEHPDHFHLVGEIQPAGGWDGIDMADALYIAMYEAYKPSYPAP